MRTAIRDAWIVTQDAERRIIRGDVLIDGERIAAIGDVGNDTDREISASGDIIIPGLINTHCHVAMSVMKGSVDDLNFADFLAKVFKVDSDRSDGDILVGSRLGLLEMLMSGTTTFVDLYYSQDVIAEAVKESGLRGVLCWAVLDEEFTTQSGKPMDNCRRFCERHADERKIIPGVGPQGVYVCGEETWREASGYSADKGVPLTFHLSETRGEVNEHHRKTGKRPVDWLDSIDVLHERCLAAHSAWLTINEVRALGRAGASVSSCPVSNMKLATGGVAPVPEMMQHGVNVSIGTDGSSTNNSLDMFAEMKTLGLLQKSSRWDATVTPAQQLLDMATINGAKAIGMESSLGSIEVGKYADLLILDGSSPNLRPMLPHNMVSNIVYSGNALNTKTVFCQGDMVMHDRKVLTLDAVKVMDESEEVWSKLCSRA